MKMSEFKKQMRKLIIEYLTISFQNEMISEKVANEMAIEFVNEQTDVKLYQEYKRLTS